MDNVVPLRREPAKVQMKVSIPGDLYATLCARARANSRSPEEMAALILRGVLTNPTGGAA